MDDDFNTARAIGLIYDTVRHLNRAMDDWGETRSQQHQAMLASARHHLMQIGGVLGIGSETAADFFEHKRAKAVERKAIDRSLIKKLIAERDQARQQKDWGRADQIRQQLSDMNIVLEDRPEGTTWKAR